MSRGGVSNGLAGWGGLPFEASPSVPLPGGEGGPADEAISWSEGSSLSTKWRGTEGEDSEGWPPQPGRPLQRTYFPEIIPITPARIIATEIAARKRLATLAIAREPAAPVTRPT